MKCAICGQLCEGKYPLCSLNTHIRKHNISSKEYYDTYMAQDGDGFCRVCHKPTKFLGLRGYKLHCGCSCAQLDQETQQKLKETSLERYGTESPNQSEVVKEKQQNSLESRYGVKHALQNEEIKNKAYKTNQERYGTEYPMKLNDIQFRYKQTMLDRYGVPNSFQMEEAREKLRQSTQEKYGVDYAIEHPDIQRKASALGNNSVSKQKKLNTRKKNKRLDDELNQDNM